MSIDLVSAVVGKALDGLFARQTASANNVANASSEGFVPSQVTFEGALRAAVASQPGDDGFAVVQRVAQVTPAIQMPLPGQIEGVQLDREVSVAAETTARYAMLTGMLDRTLQMQQLAIKGA